MRWCASPSASYAGPWVTRRRRPASLPPCTGGAIAFWRPSRSTPRRCQALPHRQTLAAGPSDASAPPPDRPAASPRPGVQPLPDALAPPEAERRRLTVLFCDLVDSTPLAGHLDPEDFRDVVRAYHQACAEVIERFDGYMAQYLGDGVLVYFGYPVAHEDDAQRAVWTGLGILEALAPLNARLALPPGSRSRCAWACIRALS